MTPLWDAPSLPSSLLNQRFIGAITKNSLPRPLDNSSSGKWTELNQNLPTLASSSAIDTRGVGTERRRMQGRQKWHDESKNKQDYEPQDLA